MTTYQRELRMRVLRLLANHIGDQILTPRFTSLCSHADLGDVLKFTTILCLHD